MDRTYAPLEQTEFTIRTDHDITDDGLATIDDVRDTQAVVDDEYSGSGVIVVIMDSGIDVSHPVFDDVTIADRVDVTGSGLGDSVGHGTAVAGTTARLAPDVELISLKIFGQSGRTDGQTIMDAYDWLLDNVNRIDCVNMSWGARRRNRQIDSRHNQLVKSGVHTVVAAGNTGSRGGSPATASRAFSTAAIDEDGSLTHFSSYNPSYDNPDVAAIGKNNRLPRADGTDMGTVLDDEWVKASGTSFSAPIVAGLYARVLDAQPERSPGQVDELFDRNADDIPETPRDGAGIAKYDPTVKDTDEAMGYKPTASANVWSVIGNDTVFIRADWLDSGYYEAELVSSDTDDSDESSSIIRFTKQ